MSESKSIGDTHVEEIAEDHRLLMTVLSELRGDTGGKALSGTLDKLTSLLPRHFEREESDGGLYEQILNAAPRFQKLLELLAREHREIVDEVRALVERATQRELEGAEQAEIQGRAEELALRLSEHEEQERQLLSESLLTDLGAGD